MKGHTCTTQTLLLPYCAVSTNSMSKTRTAADGCNGLFNPLHRHTYQRYIHCMSLLHTSSESLLVLTGVYKIDK